MIGLDLYASSTLIGTGEGLSTQTILIRVRSIDVATLKRVLVADPCKKCGYIPPSPLWGTGLSPALAIVDQYPKLALDLALPLVKKKLTEIGVTADLSVTNAPPPPRAPAETKAALLLGTAFGIVLTFAGRWVYRIVKKEG